MIFMNQEGPYILLLGTSAPKYHTIEGIMGPNSLMVVYVDPLRKAMLVIVDPKGPKTQIVRF